MTPDHAYFGRACLHGSCPGFGSHIYPGGRHYGAYFGQQVSIYPTPTPIAGSGGGQFPLPRGYVFPIWQPHQTLPAWSLESPAFVPWHTGLSDPRGAPAPELGPQGRSAAGEAAALLEELVTAHYIPGERTTVELGYGWVLIIEPDRRFHFVMV